MKNSSIRSLVALGLVASMALPIVARAEEMDNDMKVRLEALEEAIEGLNKKTEELSKAFIEGFADLRYDDERTPGKNNTGSNQTGLSGMFIRRAEIKLSGNLLPNLVYSLGYDFTENKHKDVGVEIKDIPVIPFFDVAPEWTYNVRVGQYRMPFGLVPQTSSSSILFAERPMVFGGKNATASQTGAKGASLIKERVMGAQLRNKKKLGSIVAQDLQVGLFNNAGEDQAAGKNKISTSTDAFPAQMQDEAPSFIGRYALDLTFLNTALEGLTGKTKFQLGGSYMRDSQATYYMAGTNYQLFDEIAGAEALVELWNKGWVIQSEYVHANFDLTEKVGTKQIGEGWYVDNSFNILPILTSQLEKGDALELMFRYEEQSNFAANSKGDFLYKVTRLGGGMKWSYAGGKNHTAINFFVSAPDGQFGGDDRKTSDRGYAGSAVKVPETLLIIQQQFAFETGKPF